MQKKIKRKYYGINFMETLPQKIELDQDTKDKVSFVTFIINKFARTYKMSKQNAFMYLKKYGGLTFLSEFWWTLHTEDPYWSMFELYEVCYENGGRR